MRKDFLKASCSWGEKKEKIEITLGIKVTIRKERKKKRVWVEKRWHELNKSENYVFEGKQNIKEKKRLKRDIFHQN